MPFPNWKVQLAESTRILSSYLNANIAQMMSHSAGFPYAPKNSMDYAIDLAELKTNVNSDYQEEYCNHSPFATTV